MKAIINKIISPFIFNGKINWNAVINAIICILIALFNAPEGFGAEFPDWANVTTSTFNWLGAVYLLLNKWFKLPF